MTNPVIAKTPTVAELMVTLAAVQTAIEALTVRVAAVEEAGKPVPKTDKEMTDDHARQILIGDCKDLKHNDAAKKLGLSYGQVYSCRGEYTFRHIHKELKARPEGFKNPWKKVA